MHDINPFHKKKVPAKFEWVDGDFSAWLKKQSKMLSERTGCDRVGTKSASKVLLDQFIIPNNISLTDTIKPIKNGKKRSLWRFKNE